MSYKFGVGKYKTRDGREAVVVSDEMPGDYPLLGWMFQGSGQCVAMAWTENGCYAGINILGSSDLMPPERWTLTENGSHGQDRVYDVFCNGQYKFYIVGQADPQHLINLLNATERDQ